MRERGVVVPKVRYAKGIVKLMDTMNASVEQVRAIAKIKGVESEVEELLKSLDEKER